MPYYAKEYGFEYEYVQYKWPMWLHGQTEKQRLIWGFVRHPLVCVSLANFNPLTHSSNRPLIHPPFHPVIYQFLSCSYKILFLDVLFPLYVKKIIFVDADQVICTHV